jgi:hypothetical protein
MPIPLIRMRFSLPFIAVLALSSNVAAQADFDAAIVDYVGLRYVCDGEVVPTLRIQNQGTTSMVTCVVETWKNGLFNNSFDWILSSPAATGVTRQPTLPVIAGLIAGDVLEFRIIEVNGVPDQQATGNILSMPLDLQPVSAVSYVVMVEVLTDNAPGETTWSLWDDQAQMVAQGGPYTLAADTARTWVTLAPLSCTQLEVRDAGGDGLMGGYVKVYDLGSPIINVDGVGFADRALVGLLAGQVMAVDELRAERSELRFFPNPSDGRVTAVVEGGPGDRRILQLFDAAGRLALERTAIISADGTLVLDVAQLCDGAYSARLIDMDRGLWRGRLVVQH